VVGWIGGFGRAGMLAAMIATDFLLVASADHGETVTIMHRVAGKVDKY